MHEDNIFGSPKMPFCIKDPKNLYIQNIGHIWAYVHANSWAKTKHVKNVVKKCQNIIFLNPLLGHFQKSETGSKSMCRSLMASSFQNCIKKCSSFKN